MSKLSSAFRIPAHFAWVAILALGLPHLSLAQSAAEEDTLTAEFQKAEEHAHDTWIELESNRSDTRAYVLIPRTERQSRLIRLHLRYDRDQRRQAEEPATLIRTLDLDCWRSRTTLQALRGYDETGRLLFSKPVKEEKPALVLNFYASPLRLVCSKEYLLPLVRDGKPRLDKVRVELETASRTSIPDRVVPLLE